MKGRVAVLMFPGTNCEEETARACSAAGLDAGIVRWNSGQDLGSYDGFVLPGGWSYEDRVRAGVIASKDAIMSAVRKESESGKPVLGICNGAQILIETGMIPGLRNDVQMALAANINPFVSGYYCTWVRIKTCAEGRRTAFTRLLGKGGVMRIPVAHGEGRFTTREQGLVDTLAENGQIVFRYCDGEGNISEEFPVNPNGSVLGIAGVCNERGNVLAMMPHPERCAWKGQLPGFEGRSCREMASPGPGRKVFQSMREYIDMEARSWR